MWYRVFGSNDVAQDHKAILEFLNRLAVVRGRFHGDDAGWFHADLLSDGLTLSLDRYTAADEGVRAELNTWAALVESHDRRDLLWLMERLIQSQQLFTLQTPDAEVGRHLCVALCQFLARTTNGVYQIDDDGFFTMDGTFLLRETDS